GQTFRRQLGPHGPLHDSRQQQSGGGFRRFRHAIGNRSVGWAAHYNDTGTHTSTPVLVFTQGPGDTSAPFGKLLHHTEVGQRAIEALGN
ncbi:MAG: hypothetical protein ACI9OW_000187, partial [Marinobacter psychrophilus]